MSKSARAVTIDALSGDEYRLLAQFTHDTLIDFVLGYFLRRTSWLTRAHHAMTIATLAAIVWVAIAQARPLLRCVADFFLALLVLLVIILPLHELIHALAYRLTGARDIRWGYSLRMAAVWVVAHRFVAGRGAFLFVALAPFVAINALLIAVALAFPSLAVLLLFVVLWHLHGCAGDWSLVNFVWLHRGTELWTYDDADSGTSYFYGEIEN